MFYFEKIKINEEKTVNVLKSTLLAETEHFFTTRDFVLTFGAKEDLKEEAEKNRELLCKYLRITTEDLYVPKQTHSDHVMILQSENNNLNDCDGVISNIKNTAIMLNFAYCTPIILYDKKNKLGAVVHAGWRGTAQSIAVKTVQKMVDEFSTSFDNITALIGPAIGACCYCVNDDVYYKIKETIKTESSLLFGKIEGEEKYYLDLKRINETQLREVGVENIDRCDFCTSCENEVFFSYRRENGVTARHSAILKI